MAIYGRICRRQQKQLDLPVATMPYLPSVPSELPNAPLLNQVYLQFARPAVQETFTSESPAVQLVEDLIKGGGTPQSLAGGVDFVQLEFDPGAEWDKAKEKLPSAGQAWSNFIAFLKDIFAKTRKFMAEPLKNASEALGKFRTEHPKWSIAIGVLIILACLCLLFPPLLGAIGFGAAGVVKGSIAATGQALYYGGAVPAKGIFALLQSCGATIGSVPMFLVLIAIALIVGTIVFLARS